MQLISHLAKHVGILKQCNPVMVAFRFLQPWPQTFVSTKSLKGVWPPSQRSVLDRWIPNKNFSCDANFQCCPHTHSMTKVSVQLFLRRFGPDRSSDGNFQAIRGTRRCLIEVYNWPTKFPEKDVKCIKMFLVQGTVTASKTDHCSTRKHWNISASYILRWCCPAISDGLRTVFSCLVPFGRWNPCAAS